MKRTAASLVVIVAVGACSGTSTQDGGVPTTAPPAEAASDAPATTSPANSVPVAEGESTGITCWSSAPSDGTATISFEDVTEATGLIDPLTGMHAHAAAWGDVDGDTQADLVVGTFATRRGDAYVARGATGPSPDRLLLADGTRYAPAANFPEEYGRTSGAAFADLDNDGDDDLVLSRNANGRDAGTAASEVMENTGTGLVPVDATIDPTLGGRSIGVLDFDEDGLLDLLIVEDHYRGGSSRLYRNLGDLRFEDVTESSFVAGVDGLGIATGDLNNDRHTDVFVAGSNRLFVGTGAKLEEVAAPNLAWDTYGNEDDVAGAAIADVNRDGWLDLLVGHHYNSTLSQGQEVPVRLYVNRTNESGAAPALEDITDEAGLIGIPTKAPHVELADFDNDGWPDVLTSASADSGTAPAIFRHTGLVDGVPTFAAPEGLGSPQYWVTAPTADVDRDGRLDMLLVEWEPALPSLMLRNTTQSGHWLEVSVDPTLGGGVGSRVDIYEAGQAGEPEALLGSREIVASLGYTAGVERTAHFGLGDTNEVDIVLTPPLPHQPVALTVAADQHVRLPGGCASRTIPAETAP